MKNVAVRKFDVSSSISNLLIVLAVIAVSAPVLLGGDRLALILSEVGRQGAILLQDFSIYLQSLLS
jgi:hypothetical protein